MENLSQMRNTFMINRLRYKIKILDADRNNSNK